MTAVYPTVTILIDDNDDDVPETDISALVVSEITGSHGNFNGKDADRTSSAGNITFEIENRTGSYSGFDFIGKAVAIELTYNGYNKQVFYGHIGAATDDDSGFILPRHIKVTVPDWLKTANDTRLTGLELDTNRRSDEALDILIPTLDNPPARTEFDVGSEVFASVFDAGGKNTKIFSEIDKITKSELGQFYLKFRKDGTGEIARLENMYSRGSKRAYSRIPINTTTDNFLKYHGNAAATGYLKYHGNAGASGKIKIRQAQDASFDSMHYNAEWKSGAYLNNEFSVTNVLRTNDSATVVLYTLAYPLAIGTTQMETIRSNYTDPNGGTVIQAFEVGETAPDFVTAFNSNSDGTGTNLVANLQYVTRFYATYFEIDVYNTGPAGYLTSLILKGRGIYKYSPTETLVNNDESISKLRGVYSDGLAREYSNSLVTSRMFANTTIALRRLPNQDLVSVSYHGNDDPALLMGFMYLEQGDKIDVGEIFPDHDGDYYIQGVKFRIGLGGMVDYTWYLREEIKTMCTPIAVTAPIDANAGVDAIDFGIIPYLANMKKFSVSFWVRRNTATAPYFLVVSKTVDLSGGRRGWEVLLANADNKVYFQSYKTPDDGEWRTTSAVLSSEDVWYHILITYDNTTDTADPVFYVNGTSVAVTENNTPSGASDDDADCPLVLFNAAPDPAVPALPYLTVAAGFSIKNFRIYDSILDGAQATALAANADNYNVVQDGLVFNGIYAPTANIDDYIGDTIEADDLVLEIVRGAAGIPYNDDPDTAATMLTGEAI